MTDLRTYMSSEYFAENQVVGELDAALIEVSETFDRTYDEGTRSWPYELRAGPSVPSGSGSQSTTAMVLCAALAMLNAWPAIRGPRASSGMLYWPDYKLPQGLCAGLSQKSAKGKSSISLAADRLFKTWQKNSKKSFVTKSGTFGEDDPMLLGWVIDLIQYTSPISPPVHSNLLKRTLQHCLLRAAELGSAATSVGGRLDNRTLCRILMTPVEGREIGDSSYILLRFAIILRSLKASDLLRSLMSNKDVNVSNRAQDVLFERFESRLHEQLSFFEIVDSRFDPTEIIFCLEGMLLIRTDAVPRALFDRVMSVLREVQESEGYWRSETPIVYNKKGEVLFTVSVEAANSILASFALFDKRWSIHTSVATEYVELIKRYWRWLKSRKSYLRVSTNDLKGWHSEHVNDANLIHLWETSQVAEFLVNFRDQLKRHIARKSLALAGCSYKQPKKPAPINANANQLHSTEKRWGAALTCFEPVTCLGRRFAIYQRIGESFIAPRVNSEDKLKYGMLLYGPPGTGKTTVASALAWALDYPLITVTVSDFLADGQAAIEARVKDLFDMLRAQPQSVVLFDEIDQFMLDRDSQYFQDQETVFQFLTPGMLTKLGDLRASESVIFIMATNYAERIDAAIKRQGRIDEHLLLLPADRRRRKLFVEERWPGGLIDVDIASRESVFLGHGDINSVSTTLDNDQVIRQLKDLPRPASPDKYVSRFNNKSGQRISDLARTPAEEFFAMLSLDADAQGFRSGSKAWNDHIRKESIRIFESKEYSRIGYSLEKFLTGAN